MTTIETSRAPDAVRATVSPGNCGFLCSVQAVRDGRRAVALKMESECAHIQRLGTLVAEFAMQELFQPLHRNPVFLGAERAGCHSACPVPVAIMKTIEVALGMALAQDVAITFCADGKEERER